MLASRSVSHAVASVLAFAACPAAAQTTCSALEQFRLDWNAQTQGAQGSAARTYTATDGGSRTETVTVAYNGDVAAFRPIDFGGTTGVVTSPYVGVINTGGLAATEATLTLGTIFNGYTTDIDSGVNSVGVRFTFSKPLREMSFTMLDIDYNANQFRDWIKVTGLSVTGATITPTIVSPYGNNNTTSPGQTNPSSTVIGPYNATTPNFGASEVVGNGGSGTTDAFGNVTATFAQPVTRIDIRYANGPAAYVGGTAGQQAIGIHDIVFCTMPSLAMTKTSSPVATAGVDRFNTPGADVDYLITVANSGGSPVDVNSTALVDVLPPGVTFFSGDIDPVTPGTQVVAFTPGTSGLTLGAANVTYRNAAGTAITPAAGYDPLVRSIAFAPTGTMAANSSFTLRLRTRVN